MEIKLVADVFVRAQERVLLVRYAHPEKYDGQRGWFLPDDYLRQGEHPTDAARRILADQVAIVDADVTLDHIESFDGDDWHLIFHFKAQRSRLETPRASSEVAEARWFALSDLPAREDVAHEGWALDLIEAMSQAGATEPAERSH